MNTSWLNMSEIRVLVWHWPANTWIKAKEEILALVTPAASHWRVSTHTLPEVGGTHLAHCSDRVTVAYFTVAQPYLGQKETCDNMQKNRLSFCDYCVLFLIYRLAIVLKGQFTQITNFLAFKGTVRPKMKILASLTLFLMNTEKDRFGHHWLP